MHDRKLEETEIFPFAIWRVVSLLGASNSQGGEAMPPMSPLGAFLDHLMFQRGILTRSIYDGTEGLGNDFELNGIGGRFVPRLSISDYDASTAPNLPTHASEGDKQ